MKVSKPLSVASIALLLGLATTTGLHVANVSAAENNAKQQTNVAEKIASKFHLNKSDVQQVFDEDHQAREKQRQTDMSARLDQLVKDGKITSVQKDAIVQKMSDMQTFRESLKDKTPEERRTAMEQKKEELKKWLQDNGVSEDLVHMGMSKGHGSGGFKANQ